MGAARLNAPSSVEISERRLLMDSGRFLINNYGWVVGFTVNIQCIYFPLDKLKVTSRNLVV